SNGVQLRLTGRSSRHAEPQHPLAVGKKRFDAPVAGVLNVWCEMFVTRDGELPSEIGQSLDLGETVVATKAAFGAAPDFFEQRGPLDLMGARQKRLESPQFPLIKRDNGSLGKGRDGASERYSQ